MIELTVTQGSAAWLAARAKCFNASEAPAMQGVSKYMTRSELLRQKATGIVPEVDAATQSRFDMGHEVEAKARPLVEAIIGEELYPIVATDDSGKYLASSDGATMLCNIGFEHKAFNKEIAAQVAEGNVPESHRGQLDHQFLVFGFDKIIFVVSDGTPENMVHCWYYPQPERIAALRAGWDQFAIDLANYQHTEAKPSLVAEVVKDLPAVMVQVSGSVSIVDNFVLFEAALRDFVENKLVRSPQTDQDFVDLDAQIKSLKKAEDALDAAEVQMISQVSSVDSMKRTKDMLHKLARDNRLIAEKLLKAEKENRKTEICVAAHREFSDHLAALLKRTGIAIPAVGNFGEAIKGLKSIDSMRDKVSVALANAKIEANAIADRIDANRKEMDQSADLFPDFAQVCTKATDDFAALVAMRVTQQKEADERRLAAERERIRAEEQAKAQREAAQKAQMAEHERLVAERAAQAEANRLAAEEIRRIDEQRKAEAMTIALVLADESKVGIPLVEQKHEVAEPIQIASTTPVHSDDRSGPRVTSLRIQIAGELDGMNVFELSNVLAYCQALPLKNKLAA